MNRFGRIYRPYRRSTYETITLSEYSHTARLSAFDAKLSQEEPDVFVSHKNTDTATAEVVAKTIVASGLSVYLDTWDDMDDGPELVDYIESIIKNCKSLIAVVSQSTVTSWWVPLEIGIAITSDKCIGTYRTDRYIPNFPSYLTKWPILETMEDVRTWCAAEESSFSATQFYNTISLNHSHLFRK